ncbi:chromosome segregation protein SMC [Iamia sp. SCSIO 61187]|uniref:chromosome segregation protein SMC n=1 Tax=Iamia sp. SCSIO 61187 TaxID=2722752 RepID=UPI001C63B18D|nr:chromosome segregation protein SMC [Iamia sp. SCSIO 61187]QYG94153.1 chromosome segregation protein SMC [Iamia sp. SCSIO 61187]
MFLKTLTLKGFKSFADATALEMEPGVTVVVGPNGSGKSNVVDAIAWVLGAQAPSAVRSQKMDDVIFAGTAKRPALGRAEVSLTIDNSAGLLPIDFGEVTITRTLWRSGDSDYAINGVPCRMLDIQELLSDSGVGRQQHVIISQGQIDAVLNARPEDRRLIIEEAAGILKFRRRKEKAERRLAGTEANLLRLQDLLREVRRQLRPLERQAEAARRHESLVEELGALRLFLAGHELRRLRTRLEAAERTRRDLRAGESDAKAQLSQLDALVVATETRLSALGGDDLGDDLARCEALRERARGLSAVLAERRRGLERQRGASVDQAVIASLEADAARLDAELEAVESERARLAPDAEALAEAEAVLAAERERFAEEWGDDAGGAEQAWAEAGGVGVSRAAEVRGELTAVRSSVERWEQERRRVAERIDALAAKAARLDQEAERLRGELAEAEAAEGTLVEESDVAVARRAEVETAAEAAEERRRTADAERHRWAARADALGLALDEARARAGAERLAGVSGVLGTLLDLVAVDEGWEAAFEAAAGAALGAVVVDGVEGARRALETLAAGELAGAVVPLTSASGPARDASDAIRDGEALRPHVRAVAPGVEGLLDALVGSAVVVDAWPDAVDAVLAAPGTVVVTRAGDRFAPDGWRVGAAGSGATGAALAEAQERAAAAAAEADAAATEVGELRRLLTEARTAETEASRALDRNDSRLVAAGDALQRTDADRRDLATEAASLQTHAGELDERVARDGERLAALEAELPGLEADEARRADRARAAADARSRIDDRAGSVAALRGDLEVRAASIEERTQFLTGRRADIEERLSRHSAERTEAEARRTGLERQEQAVTRLAAVVAARSEEVEVALASLRERRRQQSDAARAVAAELEGTRARRVEAEKGLGETRERLQRAELDISELTVRIESAVEAMRRDLDADPDTALAAPEPTVPEGATVAGRVRDLERELRLLGPINPLALEEFTALQERHEHVEAQLDDVKSARRDLAKVIRAVDAEIVSVFASAYADVEGNFRHLFETLFPGGQGRLALTSPEDLLGTGVEIEAKPSGKNVKKLSLLSGGERSLTALAYLFAVFRARPSPFYVMDEVEAALDDVNLHRFLGLVAEFRADAQLIIVSHQKRTMEAADLLYGVTMQPGGSSKVISEKANAAT